MPKTGIRSYETKTKGLRWLAYYHRDGKQVLRRGFRTSRQAEQWRATALVDRTAPSDKAITVCEWMIAWIERHRSHIRPSTYRRYQTALGNWILPHLGTIRLSALSHRHIEEMHSVALDSGRSPRTIRQNHAPLRIALQDAVRDGIIAYSPASVVRLPPLERANIQPFTQAEAEQFLAANRSNKFYPVYHLALHSGLRQGEILALQVGRDIDLFTRTISVRETRMRDGIGPPKSNASNRRVALSNEAAIELGRAASNKKWGDLAFQYNPAALSRSMTQACKRAGTKRVRFHDLRHTHATLMLESGANVRAVSERLGHTSVAFTLQTYGHVLPGMDEELAETIGRILGRNSIRILSNENLSSAHDGMLDSL